MVDFNQDMGAIIKDLLGANKGGVAGSSSPLDKIMPFRNALIILVAILAGFGAYYNLHYIPMEKSNKEKADEIARLTELKNKTVELEGKISMLRKKLNDSREEYLESLSHFGNSEDLGELYQSISVLAEKYNLKVMNIKELPKPIVTSKPTDPKDKDAKKEAKKPVTEVNEVKVKVELSGPYVQYIRFKEDLAVAEMLLKINEENIKVKKDEDGKIFAVLTLTTYAIDKKPFEKVMANGTAGKEAKNEESKNEK